MFTAALRIRLQVTLFFLKFKAALSCASLTPVCSLNAERFSLLITINLPFSLIFVKFLQIYGLLTTQKKKKKHC